MKTLALRLLVCSVLLSLLACAKTPPAPPEDPYRWIAAEGAWYGEMFHGRKTASGEVFDMRLSTGAHSELALGTVVEVKNPQNNTIVRVTINDRANEDRGVDLLLSKAAAEKLGLVRERRFQVEYRLAR
ncbi:MAG: septal ring lytic transglycosylase RlpA family lipoprotein [Deltaproteobacteria bacterium]|nr:septal ring lytic transglycosylase RlpA family lipoprotein [Deltaproteobacteria bacterium]